MNTDGKDHDIIVGLDVKVNRLIVDVKEIKDGTATQLADHQRRIEALETLVSKYPPTEYIPRYIKLEQEVHDAKTTAVAWRIMAGGVGGAILWLLTQVPGWIRLL